MVSVRSFLLLGRASASWDLPAKRVGLGSSQAGEEGNMPFRYVKGSRYTTAESIGVWRKPAAQNQRRAAVVALKQPLRLAQREREQQQILWAA